MERILTSAINELTSLISWMIKIGIVDEQNYPSTRNKAGVDYIENGDIRDCLFLKKSVDYVMAYDTAVKNKAYAFRFLDGAICQISYAFEKETILKHRLAFFSSPYLDIYQNDPELYEGDELYGEVVSRNIVPFPFRFDYDQNATIGHPYSHLTLGQYEGCRIPVSSPVSPAQFVRFVIMNFYNKAWVKHAVDFPSERIVFKDTIREEELTIAHLCLGCYK